MQENKISNLVSIITATYNSSEYIKATYDSITSQSHQNWEWLVADDCSSDDTVKLIKQFMADEPRIKLIQLTVNSGAAEARNKAIKVANGRYIAFLDSDDCWLPKKLEKQIVFMGKNNYPFTFTAYDKSNGLGEVFGHIGVPKKVSYSDILKSCSIGCLTAIYDTHYFGKVNMPLIRKRQDLGLWLKLLKKTDFAYGLNESLGLYRVRNDSISANKKSAAKFTWRLYRDVEKLPVIIALYYFTHYAIKGVLRTKFPKLARALGLLV